MVERVVSWSLRMLRGFSFFLGVCTILLVLVMIFLMRPKQGLPPGFSSPVAALELSKTKAQINQILGALAAQRRLPKQSKEEALGAVRTKLKQALSFDQYVIVPLYVSLLILLAWAFAGGGGRALGWFWSVMLAVVLTGMFDTLENIHTVYVLDATAGGTLTDTWVGRVRQASILKWSWLGVSMLAMAGLCWRLRQWTVFAGWWAAAGLCFVASVWLHPMLIRAGMIGLGVAFFWSGAKLKSIQLSA